MSVLEVPTERIVKLRGAPAQLDQMLRAYRGPKRVFEVLIEGPAGTGKSRGIGHVIDGLCCQYAGLRVLVIRKTRASLTESFMETFESEVLPEGDVVCAGRTREGRHSYRYPNGSEIVCAGLDQPTRHYSSQYGVVYIQEAFELTLDEYERFYRMTRKFREDMPFLLIVSDTNPDKETHFLNEMCNEGKILRMTSRHKDNPAYWDNTQKAWTEEGAAYMGQLHKLTGVRRRRLLEGQWCTAAGAVWENFDPHVHCLQRPRLPDGTLDASALGITWYYATIDWGFSSPGCLQVWGVDGDKRIYRVAEWYTSGKLLDWWTERIAEAVKEFQPMRVVVADSADKNAIEALSARLSKIEGRPPVYPCDKQNRDPQAKKGALAGLDLVRERFDVDASGKAHIYFLRDSARCRDEELADSRQPLSTEQEIPGYVYLLDDSGRPIDERVDDCVDHGCDAMRYGCIWVWRRDLRPGEKEHEYPRGTIGSMLDHGRKMARARAG